ncbi:SDR family NAD(P)-dependent oxidoreductase [Amycolatopsis sp. NPDC024027]|uniref:SDR family NAD(P)-dependent oxidoreductase n=1 Tax=Amycolatopsis sp. NPDC024027 TaxID=3154327 RepID=UPI0033EC4444
MTDSAGWARLAELDPADLARVPDINVGGVHRGAVRAVLPVLPSGGSIVVVGSAAALTGHHPVAYTASMWALRGFTRAACLELGGPARVPRRERRRDPARTDRDHRRGRRARGVPARRRVLPPSLVPTSPWTAG